MVEVPFGTIKKGTEVQKNEKKERTVTKERKKGERIIAIKLLINYSRVLGTNC